MMSTLRWLLFRKYHVNVNVTNDYVTKAFNRHNLFAYTLDLFLEIWLLS